MTTKRSNDFDDYMAEALKDKELAREYLNEAANDTDFRVFLSALGQVARAHGFTELSRMTGIERTSLYKMLSESGNPTIATLYELFNALGIQLKFEGREAPIKETKSTFEEFEIVAFTDAQVYRPMARNYVDMFHASAGPLPLSAESDFRDSEALDFAFSNYYSGFSTNENDRALGPCQAANQELALAG